MNPKVDEFLRAQTRWRKEFERLREIALDCGLAEEFKWGQPCYTYQGKNIVLIHGFKDYCALLFFKGALLADPQGILVRQTENVQSPRQIRFTNVAEIAAMETVLKDYICEAVEVEAAGLKLEPETRTGLNIPPELQQKFEEMPALKTAFEALTPGRQRAYVLYFSQPKQSKTRAARIEKYVGPILNGKGLND